MSRNRSVIARMPRSRWSARAALATAVAGAGLAAAAAVGGPANASWSPVITCTSSTGTASYTPGLTGSAHTVSEVLNASLSGCNDLLGGNALSGNGTLFANLSGTASTTSVNEHGTFAISWPSFYNPSTGNLTVTGPVNGMYSVNGQITSGAFTGATISTQYIAVGHHGAGTKKHPRVSETLVNTLPLNVSRNFG